MNKFLTPDDVAKCISALIARNKLWAKKKVHISFIVNKTAGCFTNKKKSEQYAKLFDAKLNSVAREPECTSQISYKILSTQYQGHARELTVGVIAEHIALEDKNSETVLVTCGGDGTCLEVQETLYKESQVDIKKKETILNNITLLRLPLGTGNDGTDGHSIQECFDLLQSQLVYKNIPAIKVYPENTPSDLELAESEKKVAKIPAKYGDPNYKFPWYGFNIVSIGLDAYVVYLSNVMKRILPGEFYHIAVPISALRFNKDFKPGLAKIEFYDQNDDRFDDVSGGITLFAFGASGNRVYGGGQKVLPDENNICYTPKMNIFKIIKESKGYSKGLHFKAGLSQAFSANKVRISYDMPILLQCDGEVAMLSPAHFPLIIEKTAPCVRVLCKV